MRTQQTSKPITSIKWPLVVGVVGLLVLTYGWQTSSIQDPVGHVFGMWLVIIVIWPLGLALTVSSLVILVKRLAVRKVTKVKA